MKLNRKQLRRLIYESISKPKSLINVDFSIDNDTSVNTITLEELLAKHNKLKTAAKTLWENQQMIHDIIVDVLDHDQLLNAIEKIKLKGKFDKVTTDFSPNKG